VSSPEEKWIEEIKSRRRRAKVLLPVVAVAGTVVLGVALYQLSAEARSLYYSIAANRGTGAANDCLLFALCGFVAGAAVGAGVILLIGLALHLIQDSGREERMVKMIEDLMARRESDAKVPGETRTEK
jgi:hypothetical protein